MKLKLFNVSLKSWPAVESVVDVSTQSCCTGLFSWVLSVRNIIFFFVTVVKYFCYCAWVVVSKPRLSENVKMSPADCSINRLKLNRIECFMFEKF